MLNDVIDIDNLFEEDEQIEEKEALNNDDAMEKILAAEDIVDDEGFTYSASDHKGLSFIEYVAYDVDNGKKVRNGTTVRYMVEKANVIANILTERHDFAWRLLGHLNAKAIAESKDFMKMEQTDQVKMATAKYPGVGRKEAVRRSKVSYQCFKELCDLDFELAGALKKMLLASQTKKATDEEEKQVRRARG